MELLKWKARLSALWVFIAVGMSAAMFLVLMMPDEIEETMAGEFLGMQITEGSMVIIAVFWLIPLIMSILSLTLKDSASRWLNLVLGIAYGLCFIAGIVYFLIEDKTLSIALWIMTISGLLASFFVVWSACKLPNEDI